MHLPQHAINISTMDCTKLNNVEKIPMSDFTSFVPDEVCDFVQFDWWHCTAYAKSTLLINVQEQQLYRSVRDEFIYSEVVTDSPHV